VVLSWNAHKHVTLQAGYAQLWGGDVFKVVSPSEPDTQFGYLQLHLKY
jgi:hypothetical protein